MKKRGFTIFFAVLISSLALAVGLAIYDLIIRELTLSQTATQSQYAIFAADAGVECALYWDAKYGGSGSAFASTSNYVPPPSSITCNGLDIRTQGPPTVDLAQYPGCVSTAWCLLPAPTVNSATTTFRMTFSPQPYCVTVVVAKWGIPSRTRVVSHGFNTCSTTAVNRLERTLQVSY